MVSSIVASSIMANQLAWQYDLTGQVLDSSSLNVFWFELTAGAYGQIQRANAIVEIVDGSVWHLGFSQGEAPVETELPVERWLDGRPQRPSQIAVVAAADFDPIGVTIALQGCSLSDAVLANYQAQLRERR
jgi:hypothetical protein